MLGDKIKELRKTKGLTQEEFAIRMDVVRQTVSKWEKGYSVPDALMLTKMADILDTDVSTLLGADKIEQNNNELAEQLSRINEQLAIKNRRARRIWKTIGFVLLALFLIFTVITILRMAYYTPHSSETVEQIESALFSYALTVL